MKNFEGSIALVLPKSSHSKFTIHFVGSGSQASRVFDPRAPLLSGTLGLHLQRFTRPEKEDLLM